MVIDCACGCGTKLEQYDNKNRIRKFISGHNPRRRVGKRVILTCEWCKKSYEILMCCVGRFEHHFCSAHCRSKWVGNKNSKSLEYRENQRQLMKSRGNKPPIHKGREHWNWKGGISQKNRGQDYKFCQWRKDVLRKYDWTCQICRKRGGKLSAHHIIGWAECEELRYEVSNGICYCYECHMKLHGLNKKIIVKSPVLI